MIVIVDYGAGNLTSVQRAVSYLGYDSLITDDSEKIVTAERVIFPGVGAAGSAMEGVQAKGINHALRKTFDSGVPMLGICVGCQIIMDKSEENNTDCLGFIPGVAKRFPLNMKVVVPSNMEALPPNMKDGHDLCLKIPHMGWNGLDIVQDHPLFQGIEPGDEFYFVHSYFPVLQQPSHLFGTTEYGVEFASAVGFKNLFATQFHLEKSGEPGLLILNNFCVWEP